MNMKMFKEDCAHKVKEEVISLAKYVRVIS